MTKGLVALTVEEEMKEVKAVLESQAVKLKRTFNQKTFNQQLEVTGVIKYWRVIGPSTHRNYKSDLSLEGLKEWGIIK